MESRLRAWCAWRGLVLLPVVGGCGEPSGWVVRDARRGFVLGANSLEDLAAALGVGNAA